MRWTPGDRRNIQDMRGRSGRAVPLGVGGFVLLLLLSWATGTDFLSLVTQNAPTESVGTSGDRVSGSPAEERQVDFVDAVAGDVQRAWTDLLGARYEPTRVVLFRDAIESACGFAASATGPFYCPADRKVYLDLSFFGELDGRFGAPGDFAQAYVIAHEFAHHVQNLLGVGLGAPSGSGPDSASVAIELQADCFAGVWGHAASADGRLRAGGVQLEPGDAEEALRAAAAIGDDRLQQMSAGRVMPERFTHGTSAQRVAWFKRGMDTGDPRACGTN
jgi:predicted metalloprotease